MAPEGPKTLEQRGAFLPKGGAWKRGGYSTSQVPARAEKEKGLEASEIEAKVVQYNSKMAPVSKSFPFV